MVICPRCGKEFQKTSNQQKYCNKGCFLLARRELNDIVLASEEKWLSTQNIVGMIVKQMDKIKWDTKGKKLPIQLWYEDLKDLVEELERMVNEK